jgi:hypothetical protein
MVETSSYKYSQDIFEKYSAFLIDEYNRMVFNSPDRQFIPDFHDFCETLTSVCLKRIELTRDE